MQKALVHTSLAIAAILSAQPGWAAEDFRPPEPNQSRQLSAYAGGTFRLALGRYERVKPKIGIAAGFMQRSFSPTTAAPSPVRIVALASFGGSTASRPHVSIAGVPLGQLENRLGLSTLGAVAIGGVLAAGAIVALASSSASVPDDLLSGQ